MKKSEIIKNFNSIVCEFLEQLSNVISPNYYNSFVILIKINSVEPIKQFINYVHNSEKPLVEWKEKNEEAKTYKEKAAETKADETKADETKADEINQINKKQKRP